MTEDRIDKIKGEIKLDLINHYDWIKSELDYLIHKKLAKFEKNTKTKNVDYNELIEICTKNFNNNINEINEYFDNLNLKSDNLALLDKEKIKEDAITSYCTLLTNENLQSDLSHYFIGFFIISDWYIDNNQYNFLR
jgi:hypothetical protein